MSNDNNANDDVAIDMIFLLIVMIMADYNVVLICINDQY